MPNFVIAMLPMTGTTGGGQFGRDGAAPGISTQHVLAIAPRNIGANELNASPFSISPFA